MDNSFKIQLRDSFESEMDAEADVIHSEYDSVCFSQVYPVVPYEVIQLAPYPVLQRLLRRSLRIEQ